MNRVALITGDTVARLILSDLAFAETLGYDHAVECDETVAEGDHWGGAAFSHPEGSVEPPAPPSPSYRTLMSAVRFKAQFTLQEQIAIKLARAYVPPNPTDKDDKQLQAKLALDALFDNLADLVLLGTEIDVTDPAVIAGIDFCRSIGVLATDDRAAAIKRGIPQ